MQSIISLIDIKSEGKFTIPAGFNIISIEQIEKNGKAISGGIRYGTSWGGSDVISNFALDANEINIIKNNILNIPTYQTDIEIFFDAVRDWNNALVDINITISNVVE